MRILVGADVPPDPNSGAAGTVYQTSLALRELGHVVDEIWADDLGRRIKHGNLHYLLELPRRYRDVVRERCEKHDYDVIQLSQPHAYLAALDHQRTGRGGIFVNRSHGVELHVNEVRANWYKKLGVKQSRFPNSLVSPVIRRMLDRHWVSVAKSSNGIIVGCEEDRSYLMENLNVNPERIRAIQHGVSQSFLGLTKTSMSSDRIRRLLYVGQFTFCKAPDILAKIINSLLRQYTDITFTWVCAACDHQAASSLFEQDVISRVHFSDWVPQEDLISIYDSHGIFIFPSFFEGFGKAPLEAMTRGMCVVASDAGGMKDIIQHGVNGYLFPVGSVEEGILGVKKLLDHVKTCQLISTNSLISAKQYTWQRCAEQAISFYEMLLATKDMNSRSY